MQQLQPRYTICKLVNLKGVHDATIMDDFSLIMDRSMHLCDRSQSLRLSKGRAILTNAQSRVAQSSKPIECIVPIWIQDVQH